MHTTVLSISVHTERVELNLPLVKEAQAAVSKPCRVVVVAWQHLRVIISEGRLSGFRQAM